MSCPYQIEIEIRGVNPDRMDDIHDACMGEWSFRNLDRYYIDDEYVISGLGTGSLGGCEEDLADRIAEAAWNANRGYCAVIVHATCLESIPYMTHKRLHNDYERKLAA